MTLPVALAASPPQKNVGAAARPMGSSQTRGYRNSGANPWLARVAGDPLVLQICDGTGRPIQTSWFEVQSPILARRCRRNSCEAARHIKRFALLQNVEARPRQLVRQRLDRHHVVRPGLLTFVEPFCFGTEAQCEVGRLDEGPGQVFVAVLGVAFTFLLAVADPPAVDAAEVCAWRLPGLANGARSLSSTNSTSASSIDEGIQAITTAALTAAVNRITARPRIRRRGWWL